MTFCSNKVIINLLLQIGGDFITTTRKKPGPHPENPLNISIKVRIDKETERKIEYCMKELNTTCSDVVRKGIQKMYDSLQK